MSSSFASSSRPLLVPRLVGRLVACPSYSAGWGGVACLLVSSGLLFSCRRAWRSFSSRGASRWRVVIDDVPVAVAWRACLSRCVVLLVPSGGAFSFPFRLVVSGSGEASASRFITAGADGRRFPSRRLPGGAVLACLVAVGGGAMPFSSSAFPPAFYHPMVAGHVLRAVSPPYLAHRRLLRVPVAIVLISFRLLG